MKNARLIVAIVTSIIQAAAIVAIILLVLPRFDIFIPIWGTVIICLAFGIYAVTIYRVGSRTLRLKTLPGLTNMIGLKGQTTGLLAPDGYVKIKGELWEARSEEGDIPADSEIIVVNHIGLKLVVRRTSRKI